jgi:threonine/homoserine/homoserine lactone efflux protein
MSGVDSMALAALFFSAYVVLLITPAPVDLAVASLAAIRGFGRTLPMILGIAAGTATLAAIALLAGDSLSSVLPARAMDVIAGAAMLALAVHIALRNPFDLPARPVEMRNKGLVASGFVIAVLDPVVAAYFLAGFSGALRPLAGSLTGWSIVVAFGLIDLIWFTIIASLMSRSQIREVALNWHVCLRMTSALALTGLTLAKLPSILQLG